MELASRVGEPRAFAARSNRSSAADLRASANRPGFGVSVARYLKGTVNHSRRTRDRRRGRRRPLRDELLRRSDEQLVELVLDGHDPAFDVLFDRHVADSLWYAREVLGSWDEAEEAVRHSFAAAHAYLATRGRETEFWPWLQTILGNYCLSMLQARTPGPDQSAGDSTVVDLGEWRLRRKLFGVALPAAPGMGIREGLMAASGIGAGATASGTPLLGGMAAKLAVVAVLTGGVGAAGGVASDRSVSADAGARASPVERTVDVGRSRADGDRANGAQGAEGQRQRVAVGESDGGPRGPREIPEGRSRHRVPAEPSPNAGGAVATTPLPAPDSATPRTPVSQTPVSGEAPVRSTLRHVADVVEDRAPAVADPATSRLPDSVDLSKIGHDLGVSSVKPPVDVRALLSRGKAVLSK
jgi:hypothetical protein